MFDSKKKAEVSRTLIITLSESSCQNSVLSSFKRSLFIFSFVFLHHLLFSARFYWGRKRGETTQIKEQAGARQWPEASSPSKLRIKKSLKDGMRSTHCAMPAKLTLVHSAMTFGFYATTWLRIFTHDVEILVQQAVEHKFKQRITSKRQIENHNKTMANCFVSQRSGWYHH